MSELWHPGGIQWIMVRYKHCCHTGVTSIVGIVWKLYAVVRGCVALSRDPAKVLEVSRSGGVRTKRCIPD